MDVSRGPEHCDWQDVVFLVLSWPLGTIVRGPFMGSAHTRMFVRAPAGADIPAASLATSLDDHAQLPSDARNTGFHRDGWQLWVSDKRIRVAVWLVHGDTVERWPAAKEMFGCA